MLLTPVLLLLVLAVVQAALWWHAAHLAEAAAGRAAVVAARFGADAGAGAEAATSFAASAGATLVGTPSVQRGSTTVSAMVTVAVPRVLPMFPDAVQRTSVAPVERFVPEGER